MNIDLELKDKVAVVTGAYGDLGFAISKAYLDAGASVVITGPSEISLNQMIKDLEVLDLKTLRVSNAASEVAKNPSVRAHLLEFQRDFASNPGGAVLDGRDIGTVICPNADIKFFITASPDIRAQRRYKELLDLGHSISFENVFREIQERDERDLNRKQSPMVPAVDARKIDTSNMTINEVYESVSKIIDSKLEN